MKEKVRGKVFVDYRSTAISLFLSDPKYGAEVLARLLSRSDLDPKSAFRRFDEIIKIAIKEWELSTSMRENIVKGGGR